MTARKNRNKGRYAFGAVSRAILGAMLAAFFIIAAPERVLAGVDIRNRIEKDARLFSIEVRDAEIADVLRALAHQSGFNIILGDGVEGKVTLSFKDIVFRDALEIIIKAHGLSYTIQNNVFWVGKKVDVTDEMGMEIVRLNYAEPSSAASQIKGVLSASGSAIPDARTSSVILRDVRKNLDAAKRLLGVIDTQTTQVIIEARIVEASSSFSRAIGVQWGGEYAGNRNTVTGSALLPSSGGGRNFAVNLPAASPTSGAGLVIGSLTSRLLLDVELSAAESKGDLKIVSRPKIAVLNNKSATIHSGLTFRVKLTQNVTTGSTTSTITGTTTSGLEEIKTGIDLSVTPQITSDDYILLDISTKKSDPDYTHVVDGIPGVSEKSASTHVIIKDGDTVVIGGLYKTISAEDNKRVPFFADIPLLGSLFRNYYKTHDDEELIVFLTPKIVKYDPKTESVR